ncbi:hypothetical protein ACFLX8_01210 [Chloroflexota bacterium]
MTKDNYWYLLFVDDNEENCRIAAKLLDDKVVLQPDEKLKVHTEVDFNNALERLESYNYDLIVLDVRLGPLEEERKDEEGIKVLESIKARRFLPVIFYTGLPHKVANLETPLVKVIENTMGIPKLLETIQDIMASKLPQVNRELFRHVEEVQRGYMWDFVESNWEKFGDTPDRSALAYLLARRLAKSLDSPAIEKLAERLGDTSHVWCDEEHVHPMRCYVVPPISPRLMSGDIFRRRINEEGIEYFVLLSPSCDIAWDKADWMLFTQCSVLSGEEEYTKNISKWKQSDRYQFFPRAIEVPDMISDFQQLTAIKNEELYELITEEKIERIASLDSPYCEALTAQFARYFVRIGTPDLNENLVIENLRMQISKDTSGSK